MSQQSWIFCGPMRRLKRSFCPSLSFHHVNTFRVFLHFSFQFFFFCSGIMSPVLLISMNKLLIFTKQKRMRTREKTNSNPYCKCGGLFTLLPWWCRFIISFTFSLHCDLIKRHCFLLDIYIYPQCICDNHPCHLGSPKTHQNNRYSPVTLLLLEKQNIQPT